MLACICTIDAFLPAVVVLFHPFPTFSLPCEMAGHQLYDMMHSLLHNIATGTASGSPGNCGPNLQLSSQMTQPMNLVPSPNSQTASFTPFPMMPYGGLSNFGNPMAMMPYGGPLNYGNLAPGTIMPFMTQSSMPSSLPEPQPARAPEAAAAAPAATSSTNHPPPDTRHHPHSRRSRSRHRQHRHSHSHTSHHRRHNKSHRRHDTRRSRSYSRSRSPSRHLHHSRRAHHSTVSLRSRSPRHSPTIDTPLHPEPRLRTDPLTLLMIPPPGALPGRIPTSLNGPPHTGGTNRGDTHHRTKTAGTCTTMAPATPATETTRTNDRPGHCSTMGSNPTPLPALATTTLACPLTQHLQRPSLPLPLPLPDPRWLLLTLPNPPSTTPVIWIPLHRRRTSMPPPLPTTGGLIYGETSWTRPRLTRCEFPRLGSWGSWTRFQPWTSPGWNRLRPF